MSGLLSKLYPRSLSDFLLNPLSTFSDTTPHPSASFIYITLLIPKYEKESDRLPFTETDE